MPRAAASGQGSVPIHFPSAAWETKGSGHRGRGPAPPLAFQNHSRTVSGKRLGTLDPTLGGQGTDCIEVPAGRDGQTGDRGRDSGGRCLPSARGSPTMSKTVLVERVRLPADLDHPLGVSSAAHFDFGAERESALAKLGDRESSQVRARPSRSRRVGERSKIVPRHVTGNGMERDPHPPEPSPASVPKSFASGAWETSWNAASAGCWSSSSWPPTPVTTPKLAADPG